MRQRISTKMRRRPVVMPFANTPAWRVPADGSQVHLPDVLTRAASVLLALGQEPARPSFAEWLAGVRAEAIAAGIREDIVDAALADVTEPQPVILERDRAQAETVFSLEKYLARILTPEADPQRPRRVRRHRELLDQVGERYGVPSRIIVAIWGMESNFGRFSGVRPTVPALATLAWDPRRADVLSRRAVQRARDSQPRRHRSAAAQGIVGGRDGPGAVHAVQLSEVRRGLRRRRQARHLVHAGRHLRVDRELPEGSRLGRRTRTGGARSR